MNFKREQRTSETFETLIAELPQHLNVTHYFHLLYTKEETEQLKLQISTVLYETRDKRRELQIEYYMRQRTKNISYKESITMR